MMSGNAPKQNQIKSILVVRFSAIGDVILTLAAVEAIKNRFPKASLDFVTKKEFADLVKSHPAVGRVWEFDKNTGFSGLRKLTRTLSNENYDLVVDLHKNLRSAYLRRFVKAPLKTAYQKRSASRLLLKWFRWNLLKDAPPVCERYFSALSDLGISRDGRRPRLYIGEPSAARVEGLLSEQGLGPGEPYLGIAPGASYPTKQWPAEGFARAAAELAGKQMKIVLLGGKSDQETAARVASEIGSAGAGTIDLSGRLSIIESAAAISKAKILLTNDSGLMHVADAMDVPLVAVFGPTSRELGFYPQGDKSRVVEKLDLDCRPCSLHGDQRCPKGHHKCMVEISAHAVAQKARELIT